MPKLLLLIALALATGASAAAETTQLPRPFTAEYLFSYNGMNVGEMRRTFRAEGNDTYVYESMSQATGMLEWFVKDRLHERSEWLWDGKRIRPQEYLYHQYGGKKKRRVELTFDWQNKMVRNLVNNDPWTMEVPDDVLDKLVYQFAIMVDLRENPEELIYPVADGGKLKVYHLKVVGEERLQTPLGRLTTVKLTRIGGSRPTTLWCAKEYGYMPVRIEQVTDDGEELRMQIRKIEWHAP